MKSLLLSHKLNVDRTHMQEKTLNNTQRDIASQKVLSTSTNPCTLPFYKYVLIYVSYHIEQNKESENNCTNLRYSSNGAVISRYQMVAPEVEIPFTLTSCNVVIGIVKHEPKGKVIICDFL